jgi:hypothetical protein
MTEVLFPPIILFKEKVRIYGSEPILLYTCYSLSKLSIHERFPIKKELASSHIPPFS